MYERLRISAKEQPTAATFDLVTDALDDYPDRYIAPSTENASQVVRRARAGAQIVLPVVRNAEDVVVPVTMHTYHNGHEGV